ncbi:MAG: hypothetical protein G01um101418_644 [Parcubacteria group bacterium Gr01-1014_18]|nr:MAG: hypothetical protein Greene041636_645 [Parcubacteria group bacterium Greene0416_36]TSC80725.1 MAG: hypothetical protein G01um101418_644 [Parcubacteria group bacterium Gr01-1014_18]TSC98664.1 MAG: hypothetical protein Greene101420_623 [Parcubacteria group bacterium Greene1014_20]TSD07176.1 MAG: hypothetical protein Greene07142_345 [Parcubacteria group bacterium Greene0714_2]
MILDKKIEWILRIAVWGEFVGHGVFAIRGKSDWVLWIQQFTGADIELATRFLFWIGIFDIIAAFWILIRPNRTILLWAAFWGLWTALLRPLVGLPIWDFIERWANWGAPLALFFVLGGARKITNDELLVPPKLKGEGGRMTNEQQIPPQPSL